MAEQAARAVPLTARRTCPSGVSDLPAPLDAIRAKPDDAARWQALASWLWDNVRDYEAVQESLFLFKWSRT